MLFNETKYAAECKRKGFFYDKKKAQYAIDFIQALTHTKGKWAGKPFILSVWQIEIVCKIFGTVYANGKRVIRKAYIEIPKKNGKSELAAAIALFLLVADGEMGAEVYSAAADISQANIVFSVAAQMVRNNEYLSSIISIIDSRKRMVYYKTNSFYQVLSSDPGNKSGYSISGCVFDEIHEQPNRKLWDKLTEGSGDAREQQLIFAITTAGDDKKSICYELHEYALKVQNGTVIDDNFLPILYALDEKEDWEDENNWIKVNPGMGETIEIEKVRVAYREAKEIPAKQNLFRQLRLNQWTQQAIRYIDMGLWRKQGGIVREEDLLGRKCYGGLDLSTVSDFSFLAWLFPDLDDSEAVDVLCRVWCPEEKIYDKRNRYADSYQVWEREGYLTATPGRTIKYGVIKNQIMEDSKKFNIQGLHVDALFQGQAMVEELILNMGEEIVTIMKQGFISYAMPMKAFERRYLEEKIHHGNNPVLNFCADNLMVSMDAAGNLKPDKEKSDEKIDGISALVMGFDLVERNKEAETYEYTYGSIITA
jgi:phage terminase large subunit-like protein